MHYYDHDFIYSYGLGYRLDAQPKCKPGNKPCGKTCIPMKEKCRINSPQSHISKLNATVDRNKKIALAAGGLGAAGLGVLALQNRQKMKQLQNEGNKKNNKPNKEDEFDDPSFNSKEERDAVFAQIESMNEGMDDDDLGDAPKKKKNKGKFNVKQDSYFNNMPRIDSKMCKKGRKCGDVCIPKSSKCKQNGENYSGVMSDKEITKELDIYFKDNRVGREKFRSEYGY